MRRRRGRSCPAPGLSPWEILAAAFKRPGPPPQWPQFAKRRVTLTQSGRTAIALLAESSGLKTGDEVLMSAYNCGTEVDALLSSGLKVRCVDCDEFGFITQAALKASIGPLTRAIYVIHPFGWPHPLDEIDEWRKSEGLMLFEDCALALFSSYPDGSPIGSRGEASVFSFPKTLPCPDGGALTWTSDWPGPGLLSSPPLGTTLRGVASRGKSWLNRQFVPSGRATAMEHTANSEHDTTIDDIPAHYYFEQWRSRRAASGISARIVAMHSEADVKERRRLNYNVLSNLLKQNGGDLLFSDLPEGVCPLNCLVRSNRRNELVAALAKRGINSSPWWAGAHRSIDWSQFPVASQLKNTVLPLPVHQQLAERDMHFIADVLREWA